MGIKKAHVYGVFKYDQIADGQCSAIDDFNSGDVICGEETGPGPEVFHGGFMKLIPVDS